VRLRTVTGAHGDTAALRDGTVAPHGFELQLEDVDPLNRAFRLMVRERAFDVCELAITTYLCAREHGKAFTALPVFPVRGFHHGAVVCNTAVVREPAELAGRRVGVNRGYTVTTGVWARGVLADEHGLDLDRVTWVLSGDEHVTEWQPPPNVVPVEPGQDLAELVASGELAGAIGIDMEHPRVAPLIADAEEAGYTALHSRGHYPINHLVVVRDELLEAEPALAGALFDAFAEAKRRYVERLRSGAIEAPSGADRTYARVAELTGRDPLPYGIEPNRAVIEELIGHALRQRILTRRPDVDSLFAENTRGLVG
jgi:4,5-dihydroxyphthalate decarboxylase